MRPLRAEAPTTPVPVRLSPVEKATIANAAKINKQNPADFIREAALTAAAECLEQAPGARARTGFQVLTPAGPV